VQVVGRQQEEGREGMLRYAGVPVGLLYTAAAVVAWREAKSAKAAVKRLRLRQDAAAVLAVMHS